MKKTFIYLSLSLMLAVGFNSCEGCVRKTTKKATEIGISAVEGVAEALDEKGEKLAETTTNAAGKIATGMGKSLEKQLDEHATKVASVAGKTTVQVLDGVLNGLDSELKTYYDIVPHTADISSGISLKYLAKYKAQPVVDAYFTVSEQGNYKSKFECYDQQDKVFLTKEIDIDQNISSKDGQYTLVSFALDKAEEVHFKNIKNIKVTVTKK